ncbi:MAG: hypothetical protein LDL14_09095, partial [Nitrospira sp.]|nr:hypothetical protein [Nitrospira sp.]
LTVGILSGLLLAGSLSAQAAEFIPLGDLPGGSFSSMALGVSADGSVVVGVSRSGSGDEAFRWTEATGHGGLGRRVGGRPL